MKKILSTFFTTASVITFAITASLLVALVAYGDWSAPDSTAPNGNVPAPLNVGSLLQAKNGPLTINNGGAPWGLTVPLGGALFGSLPSMAGTEVVLLDGKEVVKLISPNGAEDGNLEVNDVYLRSTGGWISQSEGLNGLTTISCPAKAKPGNPGKPQGDPTTCETNLTTGSCIGVVIDTGGCDAGISCLVVSPSDSSSEKWEVTTVMGGKGGGDCDTIPVCTAICAS